MYDLRNASFLKFLKATLWPFIKNYYRLQISGTENIPSGKILIISNHNIGALIESHSLLFLFSEYGQKNVFGFTHPFIFRIPISKQYFEAIGAVPATYEVAKEVFKNNHSLLIFPGGNRQAVRSVWQYKQNSFLWTHGWAKIALENQAPVLPVTFQGSHFLNPVLICSKTLATILVLPRLLGVKWLPVSLAQILFTTLIGFYLQSLHLSWPWIVAICFLVFHATVLIPVLPWKVKVKIHPVIDATKLNLSQSQLEESVAQIMDQIYT